MKDNSLIIGAVILVGIIFLGPNLGLFSILNDEDVVRAEISAPLTISKGNQIFTITDLYMQDTTINKGTVDFTNSYNNKLVGHVQVVGEPCAYGLRIRSYLENIETGKRRGSYSRSYNDYRVQRTGEIIRRTPQTGDIVRMGARYYERSYFRIENGKYETIVKIECKTSDVTESYKKEIIGEVRTGIITTIFGESLHQVSSAEQAARILELTKSLEEQSSIIESLELSTQEKAELIRLLTSNIAEQSIIITNLELTSQEQLEIINKLTINIQQQAEFINQLQINLDEKVFLISQLQVTNQNQANLISQMELSFSDQADIINALHNTISGDAEIISNLDLTIQEQANLISQMELTTQEQTDLINQLGLSLTEQEEIIEALNLKISDDAQKIIDLQLTIAEQASIINTYPTIEEQSRIINQLGLSLTEKQALINQLTLTLEEKQTLINNLESTPTNSFNKPLFTILGYSVTFLILIIVLIVIIFIKSKGDLRRIFK